MKSCLQLCSSSERNNYYYINPPYLQSDSEKGDPSSDFLSRTC